MEKRINTKTRTYLHTFKDDIKNFIMKSNHKQEDINALLQFIYDYQPLEFTKIDFQFNQMKN